MLSETTMDSYFESIKQRKIDNTIEFYSSEFYGNTSKEKWREMLMKIINRLGKLESYHLKQAMVLKAKNRKAIYYSKFIYDVKYENNDTNEIFVLKYNANTKKTNIVTYKINSDATVNLFCPQK